MPETTGLARKLQSEGDRTIEFFGALGDADWQKEVYTEGTVWTVRSIFAHLVTAERAFLSQLFPNVREGKGGASEEFSIDRFNARQQEKTQEQTPEELMKQFRTIRAGMVAWVSALDHQDLEKSGRHPFLGPTTLREMIKMVYLHNQVHARDVKRVLR